jgi:hypothetical protein
MTVSSIKGSVWEQALSTILLLKKLLAPTLFMINCRSAEIARVALRYQTFEDARTLTGNHPDRELLALLYSASMMLDNISRLERLRAEAQFKSIALVDPPKEDTLGDVNRRVRTPLDVKKALNEKRDELKLKRQVRDSSLPFRQNKRPRYNPSSAPAHQPFRGDSGSYGGARQSQVDSYRPSQSSNRPRDQDSRPSHHSFSQNGRRGGSSYNRRGGHR